MKNKITLESIKKSYGEQIILDGVTLEIADSTALMGVSGRGKTTLARLILGLERADCGKISFERAPKLSAVFQEDRLFEDFSAVKNITAVTGKGEGRSDEARAMLTSLMIPSSEHDKAVCTYSGGMKRRVAIARALLADSDIIIMDEPYKGLDDDTKATVAEIVRQCTKEKTLILITHDKNEASLTGIDRIIEL